MSKFFKSAKSLLFSFLALILLTSCARDLSDNVYTSDATLGLTLKGKVLSVRDVVIKESDRIGDNSTGMVSGALAGGALGSTAGHGGGSAAAAVGGAVVGGALGAVAQGALGKNSGHEYIIEVDTSNIDESYFQGNTAMRNVIATAKVNGMITVVQSGENALQKGMDVFVIFSEKRTRVIPVS